MTRRKGDMGRPPNAGRRCAQSNTSDVVDASVILAAAGTPDTTIVFTSDPDDLAVLASVAGVEADFEIV